MELGRPCSLLLLLALMVGLVLQNEVAVALAKVPAVFIFGDSTADVGNNNYLRSKAKANFPHNGIDFPGKKATGRFSNGYNSADFIAMHVGLKSSPPPILSLSKGNFDKQILKGVNFASGGSGIFDTTGKKLHQVLPLKTQLRHFSAVYKSLTQRLGKVRAEEMLAKSLFVVSVGSNDLFDNFNPFIPKTSAEQDEFIANLTATYKGHLKALYGMGARKFGIISAPPIGCCPQMRTLSPSGSCLEELNDMARKFFSASEILLRNLTLEQKCMKYSIANTFEMVENFFLNHTQFGFTELEKACCGKGRFNGESACTPDADYCPNRNKYLFWDLYHPTQAASKLAAKTIYYGSQKFVTPINFMQLVTEK
ncbi:GDSL esterase/lipase At5g55050 [Amborella trichopoda]|uniref:GDSL esterase/lipase n=1 Tax=Amborella trichopoda TaxID=13333 RepID=W1NMS7_AMBTC|nr:GDSL esterase/lipase At5g55050 [Amborella trichopoda]ERM96599.1 hypothetical protein AMTR_s00001p00270970 [Amborella trichopoda]|eukprot:XP_006829183.3 GDSL esterase/lipase At5g55050 [Amborella trichopoda]